MKELEQLEGAFHGLQLAGLAHGMFGEVWMRPDGFVEFRGMLSTSAGQTFARATQLPSHPLFVAVDPVGFAVAWPFVDGVPVGRIFSTAASTTLRLWQVSAVKALSHAISNDFVLGDLHFEDVVVVGNELRFLAPSNDTGSLQALPPAYRHGGAQRATLLLPRAQQQYFIVGSLEPVAVKA